MATSFPSDYFSYDDFHSEPDTPDCGDPREDAAVWYGDPRDDPAAWDEMNDRIMEDSPSLFSDFFDDVYENALDEEMNIIPSIFLRICEKQYVVLSSSYSNNRLLEMVQEILDEYL